MFKVQVGSGEVAFGRVLAESSAYYLLGVEPAEADRDGRTHEVKVKTTERNSTIRGRRWVTIPKRDAQVTDGPSGATPSAAAAAPSPKSPRPRWSPPTSRVGGDLFDKDDAAFQRELQQTPDLANLVRDFRASDAPWPDAPRRTAIFALDLGIAALRSGNQSAHDEGGRLLAEYNVRIRQPQAADAFECSWLWTEVAALEGLFMADNAMLSVPERWSAVRAKRDCTPARHRLEQRAARHRRSEPGCGFLDLVGDGHQISETSAKRHAGRVVSLPRRKARSAQADRWRKTATDRSLRSLPDRSRSRSDSSARGRSDEAAAAYRAALDTWPTAQSARVALMTLLLGHGDRQGAATLAQATETAPDGQFDPWWTYWLGDYRVYPAIRAKLRELGQ
jgi:hypothetical protein